jgi:hypothetical protein|tara:strand:+ start:348 stop:524 length:177 start_codon:yes stop_codon:yes gene_type:complete
MFGLFKKKSPREKLMKLYKEKKEMAFIMSRKNRKESDKLEKEADDILKKIDIIDGQKD